MQNIPETLMHAARNSQRVVVRFEGTGVPGSEYERELEPYGVKDGELIAFSYFLDEFRTVPLQSIRNVQVTDRTFSPRRPVIES